MPNYIDGDLLDVIMDDILDEVIEITEEAADALGDFGRFIFEGVSQGTFERFLREAWLSFKDFVSSEEFGIDQLYQHLQALVDTTVRDLTQPFSSPDIAMSIAALLWIGLKSLALFFGVPILFV